MAHPHSPPQWQPLNPRPQPPPRQSNPPFSPALRARPDSPPHTPGFQFYAEQHLDFARHQVKHHARLGASRSQTALWLALTDIFLATLSLGMYFWVADHFAAPFWLLRWLLLICTLIGFFCLLAALLIALRAAQWRLGNSGGKNALFFHSGETVPLPNPEQFSQDFQHISRQSLLEGAIGVMHGYARLRQRQEARLHVSVILTLAALVFLGLSVLLSVVVI